MNKIIVISAVAVFVNLFQIAHAGAQTVVAEVNTVSRTVKAVQLFDTGELKMYDYGRNVKTVKLSDTNAKSLLSLAQNLGNAELTVIHQDVVCMMIIAGYNSQNLSVLTPDGALRLTLSTDICSVADHTHPKASYQLENAKKLRDQMVVLANQLAE
jgi:hypothetical protein